MVGLAARATRSGLLPSRSSSASDVFRDSVQLPGGIVSLYPDVADVLRDHASSGCSGLPRSSMPREVLRSAGRRPTSPTPSSTSQQRSVAASSSRIMCRNAPGELQRRRPTMSHGGMASTGLSWANRVDVELAASGRRCSR